MPAAPLTRWTPTHQAVASCAAHAVGVADPPPVEGPVDWIEFERLCRRHGVGPVVLRSSLLPRLGVPKAVRARLTAAARELAARQLRNQAALHQALPELQAAGVDALVVKGLPFATWAYGDLFVRTSADVDLWVPPAQVATAFEALQRSGYSPRPFVAEDDVITFDPAMFVDLADVDRPMLNEVSMAGRGVHLDLHWRLFQNQHLLPLDPTVEPSLIEHVEVGSLLVPTLAPEPAMWLLAVHGTKHAWCQLKWLVDVPAVLSVAPELADDEHRRRAHERGAGRSLETALALSHRLLGSPAVLSRPLAGARSSAVLVRTSEQALTATPTGPTPPTVRSAVEVAGAWWMLDGHATYRREAIRLMLLRAGRAQGVVDPGSRELAAGLPRWAARTARRAMRRSGHRLAPELIRGRLAAEAAAELTAATIRLRMTPASRLVERLGTPSAPAPIDGLPAAEQAARSDAVVLGTPVGPRAQLVGATPAQQVAWAVRGMGNRLPWRPTCLPRALAAQRMLARRDIDAEIHLGVSDARLRAAHAWVVVDDEVVVGGTRRPFTSLGAFSAGGRRSTPAASATDRLS